jgi:hypothetical protein
MISNDEENPTIREEYGDFFREIGLYEKSNYEYFITDKKQSVCR